MVQELDDQEPMQTHRGNPVRIPSLLRQREGGGRDLEREHQAVSALQAPLQNAQLMTTHASP